MSVLSWKAEVQWWLEYEACAFQHKIWVLHIKGTALTQNRGDMF